MKTKSILDTIGHTPLIKVDQLAKGVKVNLFVKPEYMNPSGSIKDRIALKMIEQAEERGMAEARVHHFGKQYRKHRDCPLLCRLSEGIPSCYL